MKREYLFLLFIFFFCLAIRLFFAFQTDTFTSDTAYFNTRQIESIRETGFPIVHDDLSYGGRTFLFFPLFHYIMAFFSLIIPMPLVLKIIPNIFASSLVFVTFLISNKITKNVDASLITAFISSFIPIWFFESINTVSVYSLWVPVFFLLVYFMLDLGRFSKPFIFVSLFFCLISGSSLVLVFCFVFYLLLVKLERLKLEKEVLECVLFFSLLVSWVCFIVFKNALLFNGALVIWQNVPKALFDSYFATTSVIEILFMIGFIPVLVGFYVIYHYFFVEKNQSVLLLNAIALSLLIFIWLRFVQPGLGIVLLGITFVLLFGSVFGKFIDYFDKTHFAKFKLLFFVGVLLIFVINSVVPSFFYASESISASLSEEEIAALGWIKNNTENDSIVLSRIDEGHFITALADRKGVADTEFLLIKDSDSYFKDVNAVLDNRFKTNAVSILTKYNASYIYVSDGVPLFYADEDCFDLVYNKSVLIYKSLCELK